MFGIKKKPEKKYKICKTILTDGTEYYDVFRADGIYDGFCLTEESLPTLFAAMQWLNNYKDKRPVAWKEVYSE
jgi:hypothetical protein